jgi:hypothetical protein
VKNIFNNYGYSLAASLRNSFYELASLVTLQESEKRNPERYFPPFDGKKVKKPSIHMR